MGLCFLWFLGAFYQGAFLVWGVKITKPMYHGEKSLSYKKRMKFNNANKSEISRTFSKMLVFALQNCIWFMIVAFSFFMFLFYYSSDYCLLLQKNSYFDWKIDSCEQAYSLYSLSIDSTKTMFENLIDKFIKITNILRERVKHFRNSSW